jgi:hypothetical protein
MTQARVERVYFAADLTSYGMQIMHKTRLRAVCFSRFNPTEY